MGVIAYYSTALSPFLAIFFGHIITSDMLDGFLARRYGATTRLGGLLDYTVDRFNYYLVIAVLIHAGITPLAFLPWFLRDLLYIGVQAYTALPHIRGTKAMSVVGTISTYSYMLYLNYGGKVSTELTVLLIGTLTISLINMLVRVTRVRGELARRLYEDLAG